MWVDIARWATKWELLEDIGAGGQGSIKKVRRQHTDETACLKQLNHANDPERRARFSREATAYDTSNHPRIPKLIESNAHHHRDLAYRLYIVTELIDGPTAADWIQKHGPMAFSDAQQCFLALVDTVAYLHSNEWVHRDIKPDNIIFRGDDVMDPVLVDFGLSFKEGVVEDFQTEHGQEIGNRFLRLPELSAGSSTKQDARSDLAFLGGLLFYFLTGFPPLNLVDSDGRMPHQRRHVVEGLLAVAPTSSQALLGFFDRVFSQKISERYSSVSELRAGFLRVVDEMMTDLEQPSDDLAIILSTLNNKANRELTRNKTLYDAAMAVIQDVHRQVLHQVRSTFNSFQTNYLNFADGMRNTLGFSHFSIQDSRFAPTFLAKVIGEELVIFVNDSPIYRTDIDEPEFTDEFHEQIRAIFLRGLRELVVGHELPVAQHLFKSQVIRNFNEAIEIANTRQIAIFLVIYDANHPTNSRLGQALGYFMEYEATKTLVDEHFVVAILPKSNPQAAQFLPSNDPLETARWIVMSPDTSMMRSESIYGNPDEGLKRVREAITKWEEWKALGYGLS